MTLRRWLQAGGVGGIAFVVLIFVVISWASLTTPTREPAFDGSSKAWLAFAQATDRQPFFLIPIGVLALFGFLLFAVSIAVKLQMPDDGLSISSILVVVASGLIIVLHMAEFGIGLARQFRAAELDAGMASLFYGLANGVFVVIWFAVAGFLFAAAVGALSSRGLPGWLAWSALVIGLGFFIAGAIPLTFFWVLPYFLFYAWVVAVSVVLLRSPTRP